MPLLQIGLRGRSDCHDPRVQLEPNERPLDNYAWCSSSSGLLNAQRHKIMKLMKISLKSRTAFQEMTRLGIWDRPRYAASDFCGAGVIS
jgi:hypothetical protein